MVELIVNGVEIDLDKKGNEIKYTKQISDLLDIASVSSSYTNSFSIPKTPNNTQALGQLGISADTSTIPYVKTPASIKSNGFDIVREGLLNISETSDRYKISVIDGIIELFKAMENKTVGTDLDLSNFNHQKNIQTVAESYDNEYYKYMVADYGGLNIFNNGINIDYLTPSFSVVKLLELIFSTFGYSVDFSGINNFIQGLYITYPQATAIDASTAVQSAVLRIGQRISPFQQDGIIWRVTDNGRSWNPQTSTLFNPANSIVNEGTLNQYRYVVSISAVYVLNMKIKGYALYRYTSLGSVNYVPMTVRIFVNGISYIEFQTDPYEIVEKEINVFCEAGDVITAQYFVSVYEYNPNSLAQQRLQDFHFQSVNFNIKRTSQGDINLANAMKSFKITDFIKEIIWRTAVTPYFDEDKVVKFLKIEDRLSVANAVNMPGKFIERTSEKYIRSSYSQDNIFLMKYNNEGQDFSNGHLYVNNANIDASRTLATSLLYSPNNTITSIFGLPVGTMPMWSASPKENEDGTVTVEYKPFDNRFYFLRMNTKIGEYRLTSQQVPDIEIVNRIMYATTERTTFSQTVPQVYKQYQKIFDNYRAHNFELALSLEDILSIDLKKMVYVEQEGRYYLINKIDYQEGQLSTAECIACIPYTQQTISIIQAIPIGGAEVLVYFTYSGFQSPNITVEYNRNNTFWVSQSIPSDSPQVITLPNNTGTYKIRLVFDEAVSNTVTVNFI